MTNDNAADELFDDSQGQLNWFFYSSTGDSVSRLKANQLPGPFQLLRPMDDFHFDDDSENEFFFEWQPSAGAVSYHLVISRNADLSSPFYSELLCGTSSPAFSMNALGEGDYYLGLEAINGAGTSPANLYLENAPYPFKIVDLRQTLFVTDEVFFVDFFEFYPPVTDYFYKSVAADHHCTRMASEAGLLREAFEPWDGETIYYKALLTETLVGLEHKAVGNNGFVNSLGQHIASDAAELFSGDFSAPILTQYGDALPGYVPVWTGANPDGTWSGYTAEEWQDPFSSATIGNLNGAGSEWISDVIYPSNDGARFYCISIA